MKPIIEFLKRHSLAAGILLMFLLTWPIDLSISKVLPFQIPYVVGLLVGYGIVFASLIMTGLALGKSGLVALLKRYLLWRLGWKWYAVALFLIPATIFIAISLNALFTRTPVDFNQVYARQIFKPSGNLMLFVVPFFIIDCITNGEEIGWRGYVLPRLQARYNTLLSSLILGVIWGFWHLPKFLAPGNTSPFGWFMLRVIIEAVIYTWLYNNTHGSLLLVTLLHASANTAGVFLPAATTVSGNNAGTLIIQIALELILVIGLIVTAGPIRLSQEGSKQIQI
jgi:uncharacterized protein